MHHVLQYSFPSYGENCFEISGLGMHTIHFSLHVSTLFDNIAVVCFQAMATSSEIINFKTFCKTKERVKRFQPEHRVSPCFDRLTSPFLNVVDEEI